MEQKKYLKWYNKVGYGSGDIAGNVVYAFLSSQYNNDVVKNDYLINKFLYQITEEGVLPSSDVIHNYDHV